MKHGAVPGHFFTQSGAVPLRRTGGSTRVLLVSSQGGRRWVIPKGVVEEGLTPRESALREAWEEAGVRGEIGEEALGSYEYRKWGGTCRVEVFALVVREESGRWPESQTRRRRWMIPGEAAAAVREGALARLIEKAAAIHGGGR